MTLADLLSLVLQTLRAPHLAGQWILARRLPDSAAWIGLVLVSVLGVLVAFVLALLMPASEVEQLSAISPIRVAVVQGVATLALALVAQVAGQLSGGKGRFGQSLLLMVWMQFVTMVALAIAQPLLSIVFPMPDHINTVEAREQAALATFVPLLVSALLALWLLTGLVTALHGFASRLKVFFSILGMTFLLSMILGPVLGVVPNV